MGFNSQKRADRKAQPGRSMNGLLIQLSREQLASAWTLYCIPRIHTIIPCLHLFITRIWNRPCSLISPRPLTGQFPKVVCKSCKLFWVMGGQRISSIVSQTHSPEFAHGECVLRFTAKPAQWTAWGCGHQGAEKHIQSKYRWSGLLKKWLLIWYWTIIAETLYYGSTPLKRGNV